MKKENEEILKIIFQAREDNLAELDNADINFMNRQDNRKIKYYDLRKQLDKIPKDFNKLKDQILNAIKDYTETIDYESSYFTEKYYLNGLKDGINLMSEIR